MPILGYFFQSRTNQRVKRNLLVFVTPTIIDQHYGTGLEDQVSGVHHSGEEYADPNGWRNNAKGSVRLVPDIAAPGRGRLSETGNAAGPGHYQQFVHDHDTDGGLQEHREGSRLLDNGRMWG